MHSIDSKSAKKQTYIKLDTTKPMICPVCNQQLIAKSGYVLEPRATLDLDDEPDKKETIDPAPKRYYERSCHENQGKIYFPYSEGLISTMGEKNNGTPIVTLDTGKNIAPETPLSDTMSYDTYENKTYYQYDIFQMQNTNNTDINLFLIKASDILVDDYIRSYSGMPDKAKEKTILEYPRVIKLCEVPPFI